MDNQTTTIEDFNRMIGQETRHPLVTVFRNSSLSALLTCNFYALVYKPMQSSLQLYRPGETIALADDDYCGVLFHPDLLCNTHLESNIARYPMRCSCKSLTENERKTIIEGLSHIDNELRHSIDRFTRMIVVSQISLLLGYCVRFCDCKSKARCS